MTPQELLDRLNQPHENTETAAETAIMVWHAVKAQQDAYAPVADAAKIMINEIMVETGRTSIQTPAARRKSRRRQCR